MAENDTNKMSWLDNISDRQLIRIHSQVTNTTLPTERIERSQLAARFGQQYGGDRDIYAALGYPDTIEFDDYLAKYRRQDIARAVIDKPVNATWRGEINIREAGEKDIKTGFEQDVEELQKRLRLKSWFSRLDKLTGLGRYGVLLLGFDDVKKEGDFKKPIKRGKRRLQYVMAYGENRAEIKEWEDDTSSPRYSMPKLYSITIKGPEQTSSRNIQVHPSRVIHVTDGALSSHTYGKPRLESVYNRLIDLEKLTGGDAEMFWRGARPGYVAKEDPNYNLTSEKREQMKEEIQKYEHNLRRVFAVRGVDLQPLDQQIASPAEHVDVQIQMISAVTGIPKRILVGSERGELASSEDRTQWLSEIKTRREEFSEDKIMRPFLDKMMEYGVIRRPDTGDYLIEQEDLFAPSQREKAEVGRIRAEAAYFYARSPYLPEILSFRAFLKYGWALGTKEIEDIMAMQDDEVAEEVRRVQKEQEKDRQQQSKPINE